MLQSALKNQTNKLLPLYLYIFLELHTMHYGEPLGGWGSLNCIEWPQYLLRVLQTILKKLHCHNPSIYHRYLDVFDILPFRWSWCWFLEGKTIFCWGLSHPWDPAPDGCVITFISTNNPLPPKQRERVHQTSPHCCNNDKTSKGEYIQVTFVSFQKTMPASQSRLSADFFWGINPKI